MRSMFSTHSFSPFGMPYALPEWPAPFVQSLLDFTAKLQAENVNLEAENARLGEQGLQQAETIRELRDEIAALKGQKGRPVIKPSRMDQGTDDAAGDGSTGKGRGKRGLSDQPPKTANLVIHEKRTLKVADVPEGSRFLGHREFTVQDLRIGLHNPRFLLERWRTPDGRVLTAALPPELAGLPFGPGLRGFLRYQHHHCHVTQPKLREQRLEWQLELSTGQIDALLTFGHDAFSAEKSSLLKAGLEVRSALTVDDTGARHQGQNGYVTVVSSPTFAWFGSAGDKSRIGFLTHLHDGCPT